eukprot:CAMPEP_0119212044 /NCGR_PEP_ID=MMETSP1327-20130426/3486_1 /TAXON_ID=38833 /ORGANISM="Micromonas pusilla, Strain RCC2306" /LENGTH=102 /DNA_ID=CAMNT_0007209225 /DNA_START=41 /DNA_END=349 /DNA_ORIENTATION=-
MALSMTSTRPAALSSRVSSGLAKNRAPCAAPSRGSLQVMAASKKKDVRLTITLECTEQKASGVQGMSRYMSQKNRRNTSERLELMKYNKYLRKHTLHRELKK